MKNNSWFIRIGVIIFSVLISINTVLSQNQLSGFIKDKNSFQPVSGANIIIVEQRAGTFSDNSGFFSLSSFESGDYHLKISHLNYCDTIIKINATRKKDLVIFLRPDSIDIESIVVTATRTIKVISDIPQRVNLLNSEKVESYPATNTDNLLKMIPGVVVNRSWGIFSRNAAVTMRGMPGSSRSLVLIDGMPLNKSAGGTVNWHLITPEEIEKIEVVKGPGSALYGNNAMGGVINIITKQEQKKHNGFINIGYGSFNTYKSQLNLSGNKIKNSKGLFWKAGAFYRQGDGYILEPEEVRDSTNVAAYLYEGNLNGQLGYQFKSDQKLVFDYRFYKDKRGSGERVNENDGGFESFINNNFHSNYEDIIGKYSLNAKVFYLNEHFIKQDEKINNSGEYKLIDIETDKDDYGIWVSLSRLFGKSHYITTGLDIKYGNLDNKQFYRTSSDQLFTEGNLLFSGLFIQDDFAILKSKLKIIAGMRLDYTSFTDGKLNVIDPTGQTGIQRSMDTAFSGSSWLEVSPKIAARYFFSKSLHTFISFSTGFMPPKLDDLVGSRKIRKGFKIANPDLKPEIISSIELGLDWNLKEKLIVKPSVYYSIGNDFQYMVATGDFIDEGSGVPITVYQRQNVSSVEVAGVEFGAEYLLRENINFVAGYAYCYSKILEYNSEDDVDLTGKYLNEVPENNLFLSVNWKNRIVNFLVDFNFTDDQWFDEENKEIIEAYSLINIRLSKLVLNKINLSMNIQDLLNSQYVDRKGYLSPGRFVMFEIKYLIN